MTKVRHIRLSLGLGIVLWANAALALATDAAVDILLSGPERLYRQVADSLQQYLAADTAAVGLELRRSLVADGVAPGAARLTVAVGLNACKQAHDKGTRRPLLCALVPREAFQALTGNGSAADVSAVYLDQPIDRQFRLARALSPGARKAGLLAGPQMQRERAGIERSGRSADFAVDLAPAADERSAARAIQQLVADNDLILAAYDPAVLTPTSAKWLLHLAYQQQRPVVGFSRAYVDAGAVAAVFSTPEQIGRQTAQAAAAFLRDPRRLPAPSYPRAFEVAINRDVAAVLGLDPPSEAQLARQLMQPAGDR
ncbi:hypothetical protein F2Q65_08360 [Thiohalocapsa marina]|uniref:ABC transporter substrate-binding protein n=1 Tax=Thiohalocapsa marina TaxID=424902 RepID=A0A5M8FRJ1_9GAMM|nr:ABC transporter substrate binding protein [Thiohalocapsa marina]KAA6185485.1 hypothetical protein F2Q65_08360 [Thiohalocapsa marina]